MNDDPLDFSKLDFSKLTRADLRRMGRKYSREVEQLLREHEDERAKRREQVERSLSAISLPEDKKRALFNAAMRFPLDALDQAVAALCYKRKSIYEASPHTFGNDAELDKSDPGHPCASANRFRRQLGADFFRDIAIGDPSRIDTSILAHLHHALFDRDPAVRLSVVKTLGILARRESLQFLEQLDADETESKWVKDGVRSAIAACKGGA